MANAVTQNQNYQTSRPRKSIKATSNSNRGIIRVRNPSGLKTAVPVTTYRPRSTSNYIKTSTLPPTPAENYQSPVNYQPQKYRPQNYHSSNYESQTYQSPSYQSSEVRLIFENNPTSEINYVTEGNYLKETNFVQPKRVNPMKNVKSIVNPHGPVFSKSGYKIVPDASPSSVNVNPNDYFGPIYVSNSPSRGFSNFNKVTQKPLVKIAYSPANEVSHVRYSSGNGRVYYSW